MLCLNVRRVCKDFLGKIALGNIADQEMKQLIMLWRHVRNYIKFIVCHFFILPSLFKPSALKNVV